MSPSSTKRIKHPSYLKRSWRLALFASTLLITAAPCALAESALPILSNSPFSSAPNLPKAVQAVPLTPPAVPKSGLTKPIKSNLNLPHSPAQQLFDEASDLITDNYYGWSEVDFKQLRQKFSQQLRQSCSASQQAVVDCSYAVGRKTLAAMLKEFGDNHTYIRDRDWGQRLKEVTEDQAVPRTGLRLASLPEGLLVLSVMPNSPAAQMGLQRFDLITLVNGKVAAAKDKNDQDGKHGQDSKESDQASSAEPNPDRPSSKKADQKKTHKKDQPNQPNEPIDASEFIKLERQAAPLQLQLERAGQQLTAQVPTAVLKARDLPSLSWRQGSQGRKIAVIDIPSFMPVGVSERFLQLVKQAKQQQAAALVVDLRYNGGGDLRQCVAASSIYGAVVYNFRHRLGLGKSSIQGLEGRPLWQWQDWLRLTNVVRSAQAAKGTSKIWQGPSLVLVNEKTASCSEVFSFFAQKQQIKVMGVLTKGVGNSGTNFHYLHDGSLLAVTSLKAYDELENPLPADIQPDITVRFDLALLRRTGQDNVIQSAVSWLASRWNAEP